MPRLRIQQAQQGGLWSWDCQGTWWYLADGIKNILRAFDLVWQQQGGYWCWVLHTRPPLIEVPLSLGVDAGSYGKRRTTARTPLVPSLAYKPDCMSKCAVGRAESHC
jgi:hypothetical protein